MNDVPQLLVAFLISAGVLVAPYMFVWWIVALITRRNDVADIAWGLGIAGVPLYAFYYYYTMQDVSTLQWLLALAVGLWGVRLAWHIATRFLKKNHEDGRYADMRKGWKGPQWLNSLLRVFVLQGILILFVTLAATVGMSFGQQVEATGLTYLGFAIWAIGFFFETVGDWQLSRFIKNPKNKGKIMDQGLWRYTRHPNYFGEVSLWWGVWIVVMSIDAQLWWTIISPLTITFLILKVSGIPMLEARWKGNKKFEAYKKKTSAFFPLPPRK